MAEDRQTITATAVDQFTGWLTIQGGGFFDISVADPAGGLITLQRKRLEEPDTAARAVETYDAATEKIGQVAGSWQIRLYVTTFGSSSVNLEVGSG